MIVRYWSNNSGGYFWLSNEDWAALESAGWVVGPTDNLWRVPTVATLECESIDDAMDSFQAATGQDPNVSGCNCCGRPHMFSEFQYE